MAALSPTFRDFYTRLRKGEFNPINILMGEEAYYIDFIVSAFETLAIPEEERDFNFQILYGNDTDIETVIASAQQLPVMADRKLVILKEAQTMQNAKAQLERLASYAMRPNNATILVIAYKEQPGKEKITATSKLLKAVAASNGIIFKSPAIRDYQLPAHLKDYCTSKGVIIDDQATKMLCEYVGAPLSRLFTEVEKLIISKGNDKSKITSTDVEENIGISKDFNNFELISALSVKDYPKAVRIIRYFASNPKNNPPVVTTSTLFNYFSKLVIAWFQSDKSDASLQTALDLKSGYALKEYKTGLSHYNATQAVNTVHAIREFDRKSKGVGSLQNEYELLQELIFRICTL